MDAAAVRRITTRSRRDGRRRTTRFVPFRVSSPGRHRTECRRRRADNGGSAARSTVASSRKEPRQPRRVRRQERVAASVTSLPLSHPVNGALKIRTEHSERTTRSIARRKSGSVPRRRRAASQHPRRLRVVRRTRPGGSGPATRGGVDYGVQPDVSNAGGSRSKARQMGATSQSLRRSTACGADRCRTSRASTRKITSSAMFVAWSPTRSKCREMNISSTAGSIVSRSPSM